MRPRRIARSLRQRVVAESEDRCAYCHTLTAITGARPVIDHIIPEAAGGQTRWENLCVTCHACNEFKGAQREAQDPLTGERVPLFHPRLQVWYEQFCWSEDGATIIGLTPVGRATEVLQASALETVLVTCREYQKRMEPLPMRADPRPPTCSYA
jgi:hypothetical protein